MKVAYLTPGNDATGPNIFTNNLIKGMIRLNGFECEVFHFNRNEKYTNIIKYPVKTTALSFNDYYDFSSFDIIHTTMIYADSYVVFHGWNYKKRCITSMHCFMYPDFYVRKGKLKGWIDVQIWKISLNQLLNVIVSSSSQKKYYQRHLTQDHQYEVIPYGIPEMKISELDKDTEDKIAQFKHGKQLICGCGSLIERKGFHQLISYLTHNSNAGVVIIGDGPDKNKLINLARELNVNDRVLFLGFLEKSYIYYPLFDAYCMCSNSEGFGLAMLEAMSIGIPVVCSNLEIYKDFFDNKNVGLFDYANQESLNCAIDEVLSKKEYYAKESRKLYLSNFSLDSMAQKTYSYYKSIGSKQIIRKYKFSISSLLVKFMHTIYCIMTMIKTI